MQNLPAGWDPHEIVESVPDFFLELPGSTWPPESEAGPAGLAHVGAWSTTRQLTGGNLPGQVRAATGFSVASGDATIAQTVDVPLTPWGRGDAALSPGGDCLLFAARGNGPRVSLGTFLVAPIDGRGLSNEVLLELEENSARLKKPFSLKWSYDPFARSLDAAWVLVQIAGKNGYEAVAPAYSRAVLNAPLVGSGSLHAGTHQLAGTFFWGSHDGMIGLSGGSRMVIIPDADFPSSIHTSRVITCTVGGGGARFVFGGIIFDVTPQGVWLREGSTLRGSTEFQGALTTRRVSLYLERMGPSTLRVEHMLDGGVWEPWPEMVEMPLAEWPASSTLTVSTQSNPSDRWVNGVSMQSGNGRAIRPTGQPFEPTARIEATGSSLAGIFDVEEQSSWAVAQSIANATLGAVWVTEEGVLTYRGRESLRGVGQVVETIEALESLEDVPWKIDPGDIADRVEVSYSPSNLMTSSNHAITIWEATDPVRIASGYTVSVIADLEGSVSNLSPFQPIWNEEYPEASYSRWAASFNLGGGGERPDDSKIKVSSQTINPSKVRITITNRTSETIWMVDAAGNPCLTLRTKAYITAGETATVSSGVSESKAVNPLKIDAGQWVQETDTAQQILSWVSGQTTKAQAVIPQVRVKPHLGRQLGDVVRLLDGHTGLRSKAIITGIDQSGNYDGYQQHLTFALLDPVFQDFDEYLDTAGIRTFEELDAWLQATGQATFEELDNWLIDFGGTI